MNVFYETIPNNQNEILKSSYCHMVDFEDTTYICYPHKHNYIELVFGVEGSAQIEIGSKSYGLKSGDLAIINAKEIHSTIANGVGLKQIIIKFAPEILYLAGTIPLELKNSYPFLLFGIEQQKVFTSEEMNDMIVPSAINQIYDEQLIQQCGFEISQHINILKIFLWVLRKWDTNHIIELNKINTTLMLRFENVFEYVNKNYRDRIDAKVISEISNMSYSYFCREFKRIMGKTFTEHLNSVRLTNAIKLMFTTDSNMTEIAYHTGFSDSNYFIRKFKEVYNESPHKYKLKFNTLN